MKVLRAYVAPFLLLAVLMAGAWFGFIRGVNREHLSRPRVFFVFAPKGTLDRGHDGDFQIDVYPPPFRDFAQNMLSYDLVTPPDQRPPFAALYTDLGLAVQSRKLLKEPAPTAETSGAPAAPVPVLSAPLRAALFSRTHKSRYVPPTNPRGWAGVNASRAFVVLGPCRVEEPVLLCRPDFVVPRTFTELRRETSDGTTFALDDGGDALQGALLLEQLARLACPFRLPKPSSARGTALARMLEMFVTARRSLSNSAPSSTFRGILARQRRSLSNSAPSSTPGAPATASTSASPTSPKLQALLTTAARASDEQVRARLGRHVVVRTLSPTVIRVYAFVVPQEIWKILTHDERDRLRAMAASIRSPEVRLPKRCMLSRIPVTAESVAGHILANPASGVESDARWLDFVRQLHDAQVSQ